MFLLRTLLLSASVGALMAGCVSQSAPDFPSSWKPLNELPDQITEVPLVKPHIYQITQLDTAVRGLLKRWGEKTKMPIAYDRTLDFTSYKKISTIQNTELDSALNELSKLYEDKRMVLYV